MAAGWAARRRSLWLALAAAAFAMLPRPSSANVSVYTAASDSVSGSTVAVLAAPELAWAMSPVGQLEPDYTATAPGAAAMVTFAGLLYVGGAFVPPPPGDDGGDDPGFLYTWDGRVWSPVVIPALPLPYPVTALGVWPADYDADGVERLLVSCGDTAQGKVGLLVLWDRAGPAQVVAEVSASMVVAYNGSIIVSGTGIVDVPGLPCELACIFSNETGWAPFGEPNNVLFDAVAFNGDLAVTGLMTIMGSVTNFGLVFWDGTQFSTRGLEPLGTVAALFKVGNLLYIGGFNGVFLYDGISFATLTSSPPFLPRFVVLLNGDIYAATATPRSGADALKVYPAATPAWLSVDNADTPIFSLRLYCSTNFVGASCSDCQAGYFGPQCTPCDACEHYTQCNDGIAGNCTCELGWADVLCDACDTAYYGPTCAPCSVCEQHGTCVDGLAGSCVCDLGWMGASCTECAPDYFGAQGQCVACDVCRVHGECFPGLGGNCTCTDPAWSGPACTACAPQRYGPDCADCAACAVHGTCNEGVAGNCTCNPGRAGAPACDVCEAGWYGAACAYTCAACETGGHGVCYPGMEGNCTCVVQGWQGPACDTCVPDYDPASTAPPCPCSNSSVCGQGGRCNVALGVCVCFYGFTGTYCQIPFGCRVSGQACVHGSCQSFNDTATRCDCDPGYTGPTCEALSRPPVNVAEVVTLPACIVLVAWLIAAAAAWHARLRGLDRPNIGLIYLCVFTLFDFSTDVVFVVLAWVDAALLVPPFVVIVATTSLCLSVGVNAILSTSFLIGKISIIPNGSQTYFERSGNLPAMVVIWTLSFMNVEILELLYSGLFSLRFFKIPLLEDPKDMTPDLSRMGVATIFIENLPQIAIQMYLLFIAQPSTISVVSVCASLIVLVYNVLFRIWSGVLWRMFRAKRTVPAPGTAPQVAQATDTTPPPTPAPTPARSSADNLLLDALHKAVLSAKNA